MPTDRLSHVIGWVEEKGKDGEIYFKPQVFDNFSEACRTIGHWSREEAVRALQKGIQKTQEQKEPSPEELVGLPNIGQTIWVVKDHGDQIQDLKKRYVVMAVKVTELSIDEEDGGVQVIFGMYYKKNGKWFFAKKEAEHLRQQILRSKKITAD